MDCHSDTTTIDLCSEPDCINSTFKFRDVKTHLPTHGMFKIHRIIFDRDMKRIEDAAKDALTSAQGTLSGHRRGRPMPECAPCKTTVSFPCWFCVDCTSE